MTTSQIQELIDRFGGTLKLIPYHQHCTVMFPKLDRLMSKGAPKWITERTHSCWCSAWRLMRDETWRVWRKGRWVKPLPGEIRCCEVLDCDGSYLPIRGAFWENRKKLVRRKPNAM